MGFYVKYQLIVLATCKKFANLYEIWLKEMNGMFQRLDELLNVLDVSSDENILSTT